ncbi:MAG: hypothetical protein HY277_01330 [Ignavibacteriales bacterium]|nr:hypothetical protein [Ignavibacteriales bacterium]
MINIRCTIILLFAITLCLHTTIVHAQGPGYALQFDGSNDYVSVGAMYSSTTDNFTIEFWVNPTATRNATAETNSGTAGTSGQRYAINPTHGTSNYGSGHAGVGISVGTNGVSVFEHASSYLPSLLVYNSTIAGWNHVAVVYQNKQPQLYLNAVLVRTGLTSTMIAHPSGDVGSNGTENYGPFQGDMDEVRIWNIALSQSQILQNMNRRLSGAESGLITYFQLDEGLGIVTSDISGHSNTGTLTNGPKWVASAAPLGNIIDFTTGYDQASHSPITYGQADNEWVVAVDPVPSTTEPRPSTVVQQNGSWNLLFGSRWVTGGDVVNGLYEYDYTFTLDASFTNARLLLSLLADDSAAVAVNDFIVGSTNGSSPYFQNITNFEISDPALFHSGVNTIKVYCYNIRSVVTGIDIIGAVSFSKSSHYPVIIVPGIMGSGLFNDANNDGHLQANERVWLKSLLFCGTVDVSPLYLDETGENPPQGSGYDIKVAPIRGDNSLSVGQELSYSVGLDCIYPFSEAGPLAHYKGLIAKLESDGYVLDNFDDIHTSEDLFIFPYDWRKNLVSLGAEFSNFIQNVLSWTSSPKVNIIAHSMGGLVAKGALVQPGFDKSVIGKIIFAGTPHRGAPIIQHIAGTGYGLGTLDILLSNDQVKHLARNMAGAYQLFSSEVYDDENSSSFLIKRGKQYVPLSYAEKKAWYYNKITGDGSYEFNRSLLDLSSSVQTSLANLDFSGIEVFNVTCNTQSTPCFVIYDEKKGKFRKPVYLNAGDGTVPILSSTDPGIIGAYTSVKSFFLCKTFQRLRCQLVRYEFC